MSTPGKTQSNGQTSQYSSASQQQMSVSTDNGNASSQRKNLSVPGSTVYYFKLDTPRADNKKIKRYTGMKLKIGGKSKK